MKNVPNILSAIRILLVPIFLIVYFCMGVNARFYAALIYLLASLTDVLDGWMARRFNLVTDLGRILDPLGDKLMALAAITSLAIDDRIPPWAVMFFASKELIMIAGGIIIHRRLRIDMPSANFLGKASTFVLFLVGVSLMIFNIPREASSIMITFAICIAFMAFGSYVINFVTILKNSRSSSGDNPKL